MHILQKADSANITKSNLHIISFICISVILISVSLIKIANADSKLDLAISLNSISSNTDIQNIFCSLHGIFSSPKIKYDIDDSGKELFYSDYTLNIKNRLYQTKENNLITQYRQSNEFQINYFTRHNKYLFGDLQFLTDKAMQITTEISTGYGLGYASSNDNDRIFTLQAGIYHRSSQESQIISRLKSHLCWPLIDNIFLEFTNSVDNNLDKSKDFRITNRDLIRIAVYDNLSFHTGFEINYVNIDIPDSVHTTRQIFAGINLTF